MKAKHGKEYPGMMRALLAERFMPAFLKERKADAGRGRRIKGPDGHQGSDTTGIEDGSGFLVQVDSRVLSNR
jgi:hypothetical protein